MENSVSFVSLEVEDAEKWDDVVSIKDDDITYYEAMVHLIKVAIPSCFALFFQILLEVINITFIGNLNDPNSIATVGLASLTINAFLFGPGYGICGGIDTLVASAYGNKHYYLWGVYLNRGRIIQTLIVLPLAIMLLLFGTNLFKVMGQDDTVAGMTQHYLYIALPGAFAGLQFQITKRFMLAQKIFTAIVYFQVFLLIEHWLISYLFIYYLDFGYIGAAIAHAGTNFVAAIGMTLVLKFIPGIVHPESFHFINKDAFNGWVEYLHYGFPSAVVTTLQWASFEMMGVYSGIMGVAQLGAHTAIANIHSFFHMVPLGMSFGSGACVGNWLGKGEYKIAQKYAYVSYFLAWCTGFIEMVILMWFADKIFMLYTQSEELLYYMRQTLIAIYVAEINSNLLGILKGLIKAMGRQSELARYSILINAVLANVFWLLLGFYFDLGLRGIWFGLGIATTIGNAIFTYKLFVADFRAETIKSKTRVVRDRKALLK